MTVEKLIDLLGAQNRTPELSTQAQVTCGYTCDLLSWVMANAKKGMAWITVQTHMNVIAVAVLMEMSCVILPEGLSMEETALQKAREEGVVVLESSLTAFDICGKMFQAELVQAGLNGDA